MGLKKLFRDFFEYYPSEKKGVFYLLVIIVLWAAGLYVYSRMAVPTEPDVAFQEAVAEYYVSQGLTDRSVVSLPEKSDKRTWNLFSFDPNTTSFDSLVLLGLPKHSARSIVNYRNSGGTFKTPESLSKIYTLSEEDFNKVAPLVRISPAFSQNDKRSDFRTERRESYGWDTTYQKASKYSPPPVVELNRADTLELRSVIGIGAYFARAIAEHREALGGFRSLDQLLEIFALDTVHLNRMTPYLTLDTALVEKINLNAVSIDELRAHPYFSYTLANSLVRMREAHGPYSKISDIKKSYLMNDSIFGRVKNYLKVDD